MQTRDVGGLQRKSHCTRGKKIGDRSRAVLALAGHRGDRKCLIS